MSLYAAVCLSAFLAAVLVYRYDLYNREPGYMIALAAGLGFATMWLVAPAELWALGLVESPKAEAAVAAILEEAVRLAAVVVIALAFPRHFDDPMDGIVYGSIVGLGMAAEESLHFLPAGGASEKLFPLELVRLAGHLVMGGIGGFGVGIWRMRAPAWPRALALSFSAAAALHFSWDWVALSATAGRRLPAGLAFLAAAIMLIGMAVYGALVVLGSRLSRAMFAPGSARSLWGFPFRSR